MTASRLRFLLVTACVAAAALPAAARPAYLRQPDLHGDRIVFCAEADLWTVSDRGGTARRLTEHDGSESHPAFSPDGTRIAFTGDYDGNPDVYVVPAGGGEPVRLTWHPAPEVVVGWTPDGKILFRSGGETPYRSAMLYAVSPSGGDPVPLPLGWAERIAIDPESGAWAFTRKNREEATWKRYRGGTAPDIWVGDPKKADFRKVTDFDGMNAFPMWHGGRIWFLSDQGGTANLWSIRPDGSDRRRHTDFGEWDARWPAVAPDGRIVFTLAADLHLFDPKDGSVRKVEVDVPSDRVLTRVRYPDAAKYLSSVALAPDATRLAVVTRGEIFSVPVKPGVTIPVTRGSGARESAVQFSGDGKRIVYLSDASREEEIRSIDAWGRGEPTIVQPAGTSGWHFPPAPSPDGKWIAWADSTQTLWVAPMEGGTARKVARSAQGEIREYVWSPDGRWLAYAAAASNDYSVVWIYDTVADKATAVTRPTSNDYAPAWDPKGRWLYFVSERATNPILGGRDFDVVEVRNNKLFLVTLRKDVRNPIANLEGLPPEPDKDEDKPKDKEKKKDKGKDDVKTDDKKPEPVAIDLDGIADRFVELPVPVGLYGGLSATEKALFYVSAPLQGMKEGGGDDGASMWTLVSFDLEKKEAKPFLEGVSGYALAVSAGKVLVAKPRGELYVVDAAAPPGGDLGKSRVDLGGVVVSLDPAEEWEQIFHEAYRHERDFYWDASMGGVDWAAMRDKYAALLPRISTRGELRDLIGELIGELGTSHTYVWGGDPGVQPSQVGTGLLGCDLVREGNAYRVARIYRADPADNARSPLDEPGVAVREGDYILRVDHRPFDPAKPFHAALANRAGREVILTVNVKPVEDGARDVVVKPLGDDKALRYHDWVRRNREYVASKTGGKIGYLHLPDMGTDGLVAFDTWFYPQTDKEGMVVDVRWNGGGFVSQLVLERFRRGLVSFGRSRAGAVYTYPSKLLNGPFVVITNENAGSDGDIFPAAVQLGKLAPVIGMRSWGGVVGIRGDKPTVDNGMLTQPEYAWWDPKQGWELENRGVIPDIEVQNLPQDVARGVDAQLDRAIEEVLRLREERPPLRPAFGPAKDRSRKAFEKELPR